MASCRTKYRVINNIFWVLTMLNQEKAGTHIGVPAFRKGKKAVLIPVTTKGGEGELANSNNILHKSE